MNKLTTSESCDKDVSYKTFHIGESNSEYFTIFETFQFVSYCVLPEYMQLPLQISKS